MGFFFVPKHSWASDVNPLGQNELANKSTAEQMLSTEKQEINHQLTLMFEWTRKTFLIWELQWYCRKNKIQSQYKSEVLEMLIIYVYM